MLESGYLVVEHPSITSAKTRQMLASCRPSAVFEQRRIVAACQPPVVEILAGFILSDPAPIVSNAVGREVGFIAKRPHAKRDDAVGRAFGWHFTFPPARPRGTCVSGSGAAGMGPRFKRSLGCTEKNNAGNARVASRKKATDTQTNAIWSQEPSFQITRHSGGMGVTASDSPWSSGVSVWISSKFHSRNPPRRAV